MGAPASRMPTAIAISFLNFDDKEGRPYATLSLKLTASRKGQIKHRGLNFRPADLRARDSTHGYASVNKVSGDRAGAGL